MRRGQDADSSSRNDRQDPFPTILLLASAGELSRWLAQPPCEIWWLAFFATLPAMAIIANPASVGRQGYWTLWLCSAVYWLITLQGCRLPHPALFPGYLALVAYFAVYLPLFVGLTRIARWTYCVPLWIGAPVVWVGLEWIRGFALTGFSVCLLGHSLLEFPALFQCADLCGTYAVSGVIVSSTLSLLTIMDWMSRRLKVRSVAPLPERNIGACVGIIIFCSAIGYGNQRLRDDPHEQSSPSVPLLRAALLQADVESIFEVNYERDRRGFMTYVDLSVQAAQAASKEPLDLVVWPESMFVNEEKQPPRGLFAREGFEVPDQFEGTREEFIASVQKNNRAIDDRAVFIQQLMETRGGLSKRPSLIVGATQIEFTMGETNVYSGALFFGSEGRFVDWYGKRHLVPFGEFIPLGKWFPWVYKIGPLNFGVTPGPEPKSFSIGSALASPSICFETMVERIPNRDLRWLEKQVSDDLGQPGPNLLVNISNDGWFRGSSILDHHLRCTRAVAAAHHLPTLVSANCGLTAWIDGSGRVRKSLPRQTEGFLIAEPLRDQRESLYLRVGDRPIWPAVAFLTFLGISGIRDYWQRRRASDPQ